MVFNSLPYHRQEIICVHISALNYHIISTENEEEIVQQQIEPIFTATNASHLSHLEDKFELCFVAALKPLAYSRYKLSETDDALLRMVQIEAINGEVLPPSTFKIEKFGMDRGSREISISNEHMKAIFDPMNGYLKVGRNN